MNRTSPIYTEAESCQDCYKCIRHCPVKAINVVAGKASIADDRCMYCGSCVTVCPTKAKKVRNDLDKVKALIKSSERVVASLAPAFASEFPNIPVSKIVRALKMLGFHAVSETALGAEAVSGATAAYISSMSSGVFISSACPSIVERICKYFPTVAGRIVPVHSPMIAHGKMVKQWFGPDAKVVFIGPCIAKKRESDSFPDIDFAITFNELNEWLDDEGLNFDIIPPSDDTFEPFEAHMGSIYPLDGGMTTGVSQRTTDNEVVYMSFSGNRAVKQALQGIEQWNADKKLFLELLACPGGCIHGPGCSAEESTAVKRFNVQAGLRSKRANEANKLPDVEIECTFDNLYPVTNKPYSEADIIESLKAIGKQSDADEINCSGCGYDSCRDFAAALIDSRAEREMCVSYMRKVANDKATVLLQKIPSGILLVDDKMKVIECNRSFAKMMGPEIEAIYDTTPGLEGANASKLVPFYKLFSSVITSGQDIMERDIRFENKLFKVSVFSVLKNKIVCGIMHDLAVPEVRNDEIVKRTQKVIQENLETAQKIAYLLGENASRTEAMLNTILEAYQIDEPHDE